MGVSKKLFTSVFLTGMGVMVLEMLGTRIVSPYMGSSLYVWTALIGVVLGALAVGYYMGGEMSRNEANFDTLAWLVTGAAIWVLLVAGGKEVFLGYVVQTVKTGYVQAIVAAVALLGAPSLLLGAVSPYAARLFITSVKSSGVSVGRLYAASTLGSIAGTFLTGFWLIPAFGHTKILYGVGVMLVGVSVFLSSKKWGIKMLVIIWGLAGIGSGWVMKTPIMGWVEADIDTAYSRVWMANLDQNNPDEITMIVDMAYSSRATLGRPEELGFEYYKFYDLMRWNIEQPREVLMIGGAGMGYPRYAVEKYPDLAMTVVELDPMLYQLAVEKMGYKPTGRVQMVFEDGRVFLNRNQTKFDAVLLDVFSAYTVPEHMVTLGAVRKVKEAVADNGVVVVNMIGAMEGEGNLVIRAMKATYEEVFNSVKILAVRDVNDRLMIQNLMLVASDGKLDPDNNYLGEEQKVLAAREVEITDSHPVLTDEWSPVDNYSFRVMFARI